MRSKSIVGGLLALGASIKALGCGEPQGSGQTGSPFQDPPEYESPGRFGPDDPGGGTGNPGGGEIDNNPIWRRLPSDLARLQDDLLLVFNAQRGLLVFDVATGAEPQLIGTLPLQLGSYPYALLTEPNAATLVALEYTSVTSATLTDQPLATQTQRVIRVDLSDPSDPTRVADFALGGTFWNLQQRGDQYFALTQLWREFARICDAQGLPQLVVDQGVDAKRLQVTQLGLSGSAFSEVATVELPSDGLGFVTDFGFAGIGNGYEPEHTLNWVGFDAAQADALSDLSSVDVPGQVIGVTARAGQVAVTAHTNDGSGLFLLYDSSAGALQEIASVALPIQGGSIQFLPETDKVAVSGALGTALIDVSVPAMPTVESLPNTVQRLLTTDVGLLGLGTVDGVPGNHAVLSLWDVSGAASEAASLTTDWPLYGLDSNEYETWSVLGSTFALPFQRQGERTPALGTIALADASLMVSGETRMHDHNAAPLLSGDPAVMAYGIGETYVEVLTLGDSAPAPAEPSSVEIDLREPVTRQLAENESHELELRIRPDETREVVFTPKDGGEPTLVEMNHHVDELIVAGDFVVVAGLRWNSECQYFDPETIEENPGCGAHNDRGLSVFSAAGNLVEHFPITSAMDWDDPIPEIFVETTWDGYVPLSDQRYVFVVERMLRCASQASCDELGVPASTSLATPGGMACAEPDECPPVSNEPIEIVSGYKREMLYYLLDLSGDAPTLSAPAVSEGRVEMMGEGPLDMSARAFPYDAGFALPGTESLYNAQGNSLTDANGEALHRFWLYRIEVAEDGAITTLPPVNTPGSPFALLGDRLWSAEPEMRDGARIAVVHRSRLANDGAFIEDSVDLGGGYIGPIQWGQRAFVIQGPASYCAATLESSLFEIDLSADDLAAASVMTLPLGNWGFDLTQPDATEEILYLRGGPLQYFGRLSLDVSQPGAPAIVQYESVNPQAAVP